MYKVITDFPISKNLDQTEPKGSRFDSTVCPAFVAKLKILGVKSALELGVAGGNLTRQIHEAGISAFGLDGSDYPFLHKREAWGTHPELFGMADLEQPFQVVDENGPAKFFAVHSHETVEHIAEEGLDNFMWSVYKHLKPGGLFLGSISEDKTDPYHLSCFPKHWWILEFAKFGLTYDESLVRWIGRDWPRGPDQGPDSGSPRAGSSFHVALRKT